MSHDPSSTPTTWTIRWRVIIAATPPELIHAPASLEASLSRDGIELTLRDQHGHALEHRWIDAGCSGIPTKHHDLLEWVARNDDGSQSVVVRILLEAGRDPLVRTTLPDMAGLMGGRYDLTTATPVESPPPSVEAS